MVGVAELDDALGAQGAGVEGGGGFGSARWRVEESAVGIALEGGAEIAEGAEGVAETGGGIGKGTAVDEAEVELAAGKSVPTVCRKLAISEQTYYRWRKQYGGLRSNQAKQLKELERENARLKKLVAELHLDKAILEEAALGKLLSPVKKRRAVKQVRAEIGVSERRACRVLGQPRFIGRDVEHSLVNQRSSLQTPVLAAGGENPGRVEASDVGGSDLVELYIPLAVVVAAVHQPRRVVFGGVLQIRGGHRLRQPRREPQRSSE